MQTMVSKRGRTRRGSPEGDSFLEGIRNMVESGALSKMSFNLLRMQVVGQVQTYSSELPFLQEKVSDTFLELCDLMVDGRLSKMPQDVFKVYLALVARRAGMTPKGPADLGDLAEQTGIRDRMSIRIALETLKEEGFIESVEDPVLMRKKSSGKKTGLQEGLFLL